MSHTLELPANLQFLQDGTRLSYELKRHCCPLRKLSTMGDGSTQLVYHQFLSQQESSTDETCERLVSGVDAEEIEEEMLRVLRKCLVHTDIPLQAWETLVNLIHEMSRDRSRLLRDTSQFLSCLEDASPYWYPGRLDHFARDSLGILDVLFTRTVFVILERGFPQGHPLGQLSYVLLPLRQCLRKPTFELIVLVLNRFVISTRRHSQKIYSYIFHKCIALWVYVLALNYSLGSPLGLSQMPAIAVDLSNRVTSSAWNVTESWLYFGSFVNIIKIALTGVVTDPIAWWCYALLYQRAGYSLLWTVLLSSFYSSVFYWIGLGRLLFYITHVGMICYFWKNVCKLLYRFLLSWLSFFWCYARCGNVARSLTEFEDYPEADLVDGRLIVRSRDLYRNVCTSPVDSQEKEQEQKFNDTSPHSPRVFQELDAKEGEHVTTTAEWGIQNLETLMSQQSLSNPQSLSSEQKFQNCGFFSPGKRSQQEPRRRRKSKSKPSKIPTLHPGSPLAPRESNWSAPYSVRSRNESVEHKSQHSISPDFHFQPETVEQFQRSQTEDIASPQPFQQPSQQHSQQPFQQPDQIYTLHNSDNDHIIVDSSLTATTNIAVSPRRRRHFSCHNPQCSRDSLNSRRKFKRCGRCMKVRYCSKVCNKKSWKEHKKSCLPP